MKSYNPFGREGAGAPLRDTDGRIVAERIGYFSSPQKTVNLNISRDAMSPNILLMKK